MLYSFVRSISFICAVYAYAKEVYWKYRFTFRKKRSPKMGWDPVQTFTDIGGASNNTRMKYRLRFCCSWNWSACLFIYKAQKYAIIHSPTFHNCKWTLFVLAHHGFSKFWHTYTQLPKSPWPQEAVAKGSLFLPKHIDSECRLQI